MSELFILIFAAALVVVMAASVRGAARSQRVPARIGSASRRDGRRS